MRGQTWRPKWYHDDHGRVSSGAATGSRAPPVAPPATVLWSSLVAGCNGRYLLTPTRARDWNGVIVETSEQAADETVTSMRP
jgi:hypothetical protein